MSTSQDQLLSHATFLRSLASALVRDDATAMDLTQDSWVRALEQPPRNPGSLRSWLATVLRRLATRRLRDEARRQRRERVAAQPEQVGPPEDALHREHVLRRVTDGVLALEDTEREVVLLRFYEGLPPREMARRLEISVSAVQSRLRRALLKLREKLATGLSGSDWRLALIGCLGLPRGGLPRGALPRGGPEPAATGAATSKLGQTMLMTTKNKGLLVAVALLMATVLAVAWSTNAGGDAKATSDPKRNHGSSSTVRGGPVPAQENVAAREPMQSSARKEADRIRPGATTETIGVQGRVVDERRRPVADAEVLFHVRVGAPVRGRTRSNGAFALEVPAASGRLQGGLYVQDGTGACGLEQVYHEVASSGRTCDVGTISLVATYGLRVVVANGTTAERRVRVFARPLWTGWEAYVWRGLTDDAGATKLTGLLPGRYRLDAVAEDGRRCGGLVEVQRNDQTRVLDLAATGLLIVQVSSGTTGQPIRNAEIRVWQRVQLEGNAENMIPLHTTARLGRTDAKGVLRIAGVTPGDHVLVTASAAGYGRTAPVEARGAVLPVRVLIKMRDANRRSVRWQIVRGDVPPPPPGARIQLQRESPTAGVLPAWVDDRPDPTPPTATVETGSLWVSGLADGACRFLAVGPDGERAQLSVPAAGEDGGRVSFWRPRHLRVRVVDADRVPIAGCRLRFTGTSLGSAERFQRTDAEGRAQVGGLRPGKVLIELGQTQYLGVVDLTDGDGELQVVRPIGRRIVAQVWVDGEARLPPHYKLVAENGHCSEPVEDPVQGRLRFTVWPKDPLQPTTLVLYPPWGYRTATARLDPGAARGETKVTLRTAKGARGLVRVLARPEGQCRLVLQRGNGRGQWWTYRNYRANTPPAGGTYTFRNLLPGWYRAKDGLTGVAGKAGQVTEGMQELRLLLDLSSLVRVRGVVRAPAGGSLTDARVLVSGWGRERSQVLRPDQDGAFELWAVPGRELRLQVRHPKLQAAPGSKDRKVVVPSSHIVLSLIEKD